MDLQVSDHAIHDWREQEMIESGAEALGGRTRSLRVVAGVNVGRVERRSWSSWSWSSGNVQQSGCSPGCVSADDSLT
jgi:hypothetical protein